jgi:predicted esterase
MRDETYGGLRVRVTGGRDRRGGGDGPLVVLMHGFGAPGDDLVPSEVRFAFPEAPLDLGPEADGGARLVVDRHDEGIARGDAR